MSLVKAYSSIRECSPNTNITLRYYGVRETGCSMMMVSPFSSSVLNLVCYPLTPLPEVRMSPDPATGLKMVTLSLSLNFYWKIDYISGSYCFFLVMGLACLPSLNLSLAIFIV
jgi:hypothetical protein